MVKPSVPGWICGACKMMHRSYYECLDCKCVPVDL